MNILNPTPLNPSGRFFKKDPDVHKITDNLHDIDGIIEAIVDLQKEKDFDDPELEKGWHTLLILDDCLGVINKHKGYLNTLASKYRHYRLSIIITTQRFRELSPIIRSNAGYYIIYKTHNRKELQALDDELSSNIPNFMQLYSDATHKKYNFLYINLEKDVAYQNFSSVVWQKE